MESFQFPWLTLYFASWNYQMVRLSDDQPEMFVQSFRASSFLHSLDWLPIRVKPGESAVAVAVAELILYMTIRPGLPTPSPRQGAPSTPVQRSPPDRPI